MSSLRSHDRDRPSAPPAPQPAGQIDTSLTLLFALAVGVIITNLFAAQTLIGQIAPTFGLGEAAGGLVAMMPLLGYAAGLFFLVPLADLLENRKLILRLIACAVLAATAVAAAPTATALLICLLLLGAACSAIQVLVPIAAAMAPPERRGRVIGDVMSGLMIGIVLSRPLASTMADAFGWRSFYAATALLMILLVLILVRRLSERRPPAQASYRSLIGSLWHLLRAEPVLRRRALTASLGMAAFSLFWTAVALRLAEPPFDLDQGGIALFALVGAGGAIGTPLAGRAGDRGWTRITTIACHLLIVAVFLVAGWSDRTASGMPVPSLVVLAVSAFLLDVAVTGDQTLGRRAVNMLRPEARGRLNALFVGLFFVGGAIGSLVAGTAWSTGGWPVVCAIGAGLGLACLLVDRIGGAD